MGESTTQVKDWALAGNPLEQACVAYGDFWRATQQGDAEIPGLVNWLEQTYELRRATASQISRLLRAAGLIPRPAFPSGETALSVTDVTRASVTLEELCELLGLDVPEAAAASIEASVS